MHDNLLNLSLPELRQIWAAAWGTEPHAKIGRTMLIKSIQYKRREQATGGLQRELQQRLKTLVAAYKRNPRYFDEGLHGLKPGTRLVKTWKEKRHTVLVVKNGFEYEDRIYTSLSEIAATITGSRWNGWVFFGLKKHNRKTGSEVQA
ncbi:MAG: DUF2924 domain-containing protein [Alphaproteobacteria bacterium]|nr:DUF2924 domain-containing protein [Alphaproteobacteria bacterium]